MNTDAFIGLGSNLQEPAAQLARAVAELAALPDTTLIAQSPFYASSPVGPQDQPDFVNGAVWLSTGLDAHALLDQLQAIEKAHGRERLRHWGPRTLDLDLLVFGSQMLNDDRLTDLTLPTGTTVNALRAQCPDNRLRQLHPPDYP